jgi:hypothetical protein
MRNKMTNIELQECLARLDKWRTYTISDYTDPDSDGRIMAGIEKELLLLEKHIRTTPTVPEGWQLVPIKLTPEMADGAMVAHYGAKGVKESGGCYGIAITANGTDYNGLQAMKRFWKGALKAAPKPE